MKRNLIIILYTLIAVNIMAGILIATETLDTIISSPFVYLLISIISAVELIIVYYLEGRIKNEGPAQRNTIDKLIAQYGTPEDIITVLATCANETTGAVLVYKDFFVIKGQRVNKSDIKEITFNNRAIAYTQNEYQIIVVVEKEAGSNIHIDTGADLTWTREVAEQIKQHL